MYKPRNRRLNMDPNSKSFKDNLIENLMATVEKLKEDIARNEEDQSLTDSFISDLQTIAFTQQKQSGNQSPIKKGLPISPENKKQFIADFKQFFLRSSSDLHRLEQSQHSLSYKALENNDLICENNKYKHEIKKLNEKLKNSYSVLKKYVKYITHKDNLLKSQQDLINEYEKKIKDLNECIESLESTNTLIQTQLDDTVKQYMNTLSILNEKETNLFNVEQDLQKQKDRNSYLMNKYKDHLDIEKTNLIDYYEGRMNEKYIKHGSELKQLERNFSDKISEVIIEHESEMMVVKLLKEDELYKMKQLVNNTWNETNARIFKAENKNKKDIIELRDEVYKLKDSIHQKNVLIEDLSNNTLLFENKIESLSKENVDLQSKTEYLEQMNVILKKQIEDNKKKYFFGLF